MGCGLCIPVFDLFKQRDTEDISSLRYWSLRLCGQPFIAFLSVYRSWGYDAAADVVDLMYSLGYSYVENLTWVLTHANNSTLHLPHQYSCRSHITLYIFRREGRSLFTAGMQGGEAGGHWKWRLQQLAHGVT